MSGEVSLIGKVNYPTRVPNGCIITVLSTKENYLCKWLNVSRKWQLENIEEHTEPTKTLANCTKDKIKTEWELHELLVHGVIKVVSIPSYLIEVWNTK